MPQRVFFPVRSNSKALVAGVGVSHVRRRLKLASLIYEEVLIEGRSYSVQAGPGGSFRGPGRGDTWQTPAERRRAQAAKFQINMAIESTPGVPAPGPFTNFINSDAAISWDATLLPFQSEIPPECDWISFVLARPLQPQTEAVVKEWSRRDARNHVLEQEQPISFVRSAIIDHANLDLGSAVEGQSALSVDGLHREVIRARLNDDTVWKMTSFAVPILFPFAPDLPWGDILSLRRNRSVIEFRQILGEIESETQQMITNQGDLEDAVHRAYAAKLARASGKIDSLGVAVRKAVVAVGFSVGIGFATMPITGPIGPIIGAVPGAIKAGRDLINRKRSGGGWIAFDNAIRSLG